MDILLIGSGGREHSLAWKIAKSQMVERLICMPGNPGMASLATCVEDQEVVGFCKKEKIDLVVVGPEGPLADGLADRLEAAGIPCFGPSGAAAQLESSKSFTKGICDSAGVPTAAYGHFSEPSDAKAFLSTMAAPFVIKADGLAAGKGVMICADRAEAEAAIDTLLMISGSVVIEEFMQGYEVSVFAVTDGHAVQRFGHASDYKRAHDGDTGPNTGGMGAVSPALGFNEELEEQAYREIIEPTLAELRRRGIIYRGVLYAGLMITPEGPKLVEFNCRFGDPECQLIMRRLSSDIVPALMAAAKGTLGECEPQAWRDETGVLITYAADGYPGGYEKGTLIEGLEEAEANEGALVFHAGTSRLTDGRLTASGGRVLSVTALGADREEARRRAYKAAEKIHWPSGFYRTDIADTERRG
ncbi:MAG: phosphoribosylamine--glycine ligase [Pseudomonadota bacterium]